MLLDNGADSSKTDEYGNTFLHYACANGLFSFYSLNNQLIKPILDSVNKSNEFGDTPLFFALQFAWDEDEEILLKTVKKLVELGADLNIENYYGYTLALLISMLRNFKKLSEYLVQNGAKQHGKLELDGEVIWNHKAKYGQVATKSLVKEDRKELVLRIIENYYFKNYTFYEHQKTECEYLRELTKIGLGRFSNEFYDNDWSEDQLDEFYDNDIDPIPEPKRTKDTFKPSGALTLTSIGDDSLTGESVKKYIIKKICGSEGLDTNVFKEDHCSICMSCEPERVFLPCKHKSVCSDCCKVGDFKICPVCRADIELII